MSKNDDALSFDMKTLAITTTFNESYGGPAYSSTSLHEYLAKHGVEPTLYTFGNSEAAGKSPFLSSGGVHVVVGEEVSVLSYPRSTVREFKKRLCRIVAENRVKVMHCHEIWTPAKHYFAQVSSRMGVPLVITPHGSLTEWSFHHKYYKKVLAWHAYQKRDMNSAAVIHATSLQEARDIRKLGIDRPIAVIPNGVNAPTINQLGRKKKSKRRALFLSRINPKKGLEMLVEAWSILRPDKWELIICGPREGNCADLIQRSISRYKLDDDVHIVDAVYGVDKWKMYMSSDLFVLPTHSENYGIVVAEALACGVPVITTTGAPWSDLVQYKCGWWIPDDLYSLVGVLGDAFGVPESRLRAMGKNGRKYVLDKYSWDVIARDMLRVYRWIIGEGAEPKEILYPVEDK